MKVFLIILLLQAVYCDWLQDPKLVKYVVNRVECKPFNPKFIEKAVCSTKALNRTARFHKYEIFIRPELKIGNIFIEITTYKKFGTTYRPTLVFLKENLCNILENAAPDSFAAKVIKPWLNGNASASNYFEPCPMMGKKYRYWTSDENKIDPLVPPLMPIGEWKLESKLVTYMNGVKEFLVNLYEIFEVKQLTATQF